jgi:hypothetical protein
LIETSGVDLSKIVVMFDFDGTLTHPTKKPVFNKNGTPLISSKTGQQATKAILKIRGGKSTKDFLLYLNEKNIPWFINTAAGPGNTTAVAIESRRMSEEFEGTPDGIPCSVCVAKLPELQPLTDYNNKDAECMTPKQIKVNEINIGMQYNIISAGYEKDAAAEYILTNLPSMPELVIFVDDNAINISKIYNYMVAKHPEMKFIGVVAEPFVEESDHRDGMATLAEAGKPSMQELSSEYSSGGRRRSCTFRKSRKRRSSRKLRR